MRVLDDRHVHDSVSAIAARRPAVRGAALLFAVGAAVALLPPGVASALGLTAGTPTVALSPFQPNSTATGTGTLLPVTGGAWTLQASALSSGFLTAAATGCAHSEATLAHPLTVTVTAGIGIAGGAVTSSGAIALSGSNQTVATGSGTILTGSLNTAYSQSIGTTEVLLAGCVYSTTVTFTLQ